MVDQLAQPSSDDLGVKGEQDSQSSSFHARATTTLAYRRMKPVMTTRRRSIVTTGMPISLRVGGLSKLETMPSGGLIPGAGSRESARLERDSSFQPPKLSFMVHVVERGRLTLVYFLGNGIKVWNKIVITTESPGRGSSRQYIRWGGTCSASFLILELNILQYYVKCITQVGAVYYLVSRRGVVSNNRLGAVQIQTAIGRWYSECNAACPKCLYSILWLCFIY